MGDQESDSTTIHPLGETGGIRSMGAGRWMSILNTLTSGEHMDQLVALGELSAFLSYANEDSMVGFPSWKYLKVLMHIINNPGVKYESVNSNGGEQGNERMPAMQGPSRFRKLLRHICRRKGQRTSDDSQTEGFSEFNDQVDESSSSSSSSPSSSDGGGGGGDDNDNDNDDHGDDADGNYPITVSPSVSDTPVENVESNEEPITDDLAANKAITAATCLNTILDIMPHASSFFITYKCNLDILQKVLQNIEYIDLAERILLVYEKLIKEIPVTIVKTGALVSMLRYFEFFPMDVQIGTFTAVMTAVKRIERGESVRNYLIPLVPHLTQALDSDNKRIVQMACGIWKTTISAAIRASYKSGTHSSEVIGTLVRAAVSVNAVLHMCQLVFGNSNKVSRENVIQGLYCLAIICNESNEVLSQFYELNVLVHVKRWISHSGESMVLRLVDLGLGMLGSYHTIEPLVTNCNQLYQRGEYFSREPKKLAMIADTFTMEKLLDIYDQTISQQLRNRIMLLVVRLLEMAAEVEECRDQIVEGIPLSKLLEAICYTLRYNGNDASTEVAVHAITCLLRLLEHSSISRTLSRHGVSSLLTSLKNSKLHHEVCYIMDALPQVPASLSIKSGYELIAEIKMHGNSLTLNELVQRGILDIDYERIISTDSLPALLRSILREDSKTGSLELHNVDVEGIRSLWTAFSNVLESQSEFTTCLKDDRSSKSTSSKDVDRDNVTVEHLDNYVDLGATDSSVKGSVGNDTEEPQCGSERSSLSSNDTPELPQDVLLDLSRDNAADETDIHIDLSNVRQMADEQAEELEQSIEQEIQQELDLELEQGVRQELDPEIERAIEQEWEREVEGRVPIDLTRENLEATHCEPPNNSVQDDDQVTLQIEPNDSQPNTASSRIGDTVRVLLEEGMFRTNPIFASPEVLRGLCENLASEFTREQQATEPSEDTSRSRSRRSESRLKRCSDKQIRNRNRLQTIGYMTRFTRNDGLPFPFSYINRDVKIKLSSLEKEDELMNLPILSIYISPLVSVSKVESHLLTYMNKREQDIAGSSRSAPKKRAKTEGNLLPDGEDMFMDVQLYYKGVALAPTMSLYRALVKLTDGTRSSIWKESHNIQYLLTRKSTGSMEMHQIQSGRYSPLMADVADERHSPLSLFLGLSTYLNGWEGTIIGPMMSKICERIIEDNFDDTSISLILEETFSLYSQGGDLDNRSKVTQSCVTDSAMEYLHKRVLSALNSMDRVINSELDSDILVTRPLESKESYDLSQESRNHLKILVVLNTIFTELNVSTGTLDFQLSFSKRLTLKLLTILGAIEKTLCYQVPTWFIHLVMICPTLFSFDSRKVLFDLLATGTHRFLSQFHNRLSSLVDSGSAPCKDCENFTMDPLDEIIRQRLLSVRTIKPSSLQEIESVMQVPKLKATCSRSDILMDAILIMDQFVRTASDSNAIPRLEIEFENEVGVGTGPTQEFYSLVIESIIVGDENGQSPLEKINELLYPKVVPPTSIMLDDFSLDMFKRASKSTVEYSVDGQGTVVNSSGVPDTANVRVFRIFKLLGQLVALALLDQKLLNLYIHPLFWYICQNPTVEPNCSLSTLRSVDLALATSLGNLISEDLEFVELFFTYNGVPVVPGGDKLRVTRDNVSDYIKSVVRMRLYDGIKLPVWAFRMGFATIAPLGALSLFTPTELTFQLFTTKDQNEFWTVEHLQTYIIPDHGYDLSSVTYRCLISVLSGLCDSDRRRFLRFCTGAPVLPKQGFAGLRPMMRVVKKGDNHHELPSVMTCSNYLKLPSYSSDTQLRMKLLHAIRDGQGSFHLS
ncbi:E3 ubiquitin-protein ligase TRIP12 [Babesia sp. Xinjiang]|uniref:E3 ubiquitin-protein ligase TRIP12 n=1 Tax=Babesia sp. Xinjiang TaxID=462227 RepID=UPI000A263E7B|nr:E3 ubiquitin-protein ligase TRIP12 [Babesia sp. Xinjiang]ORM40434.1 E3 ubiquitin-protein ligase TRIP12 [Babesia sp. Xinjiang]